MHVDKKLSNTLSNMFLFLYEVKFAENFGTSSGAKYQASVIVTRVMFVKDTYRL
jgi:hypothetical protein